MGKQSQLSLRVIRRDYTYQGEPRHEYLLGSVGQWGAEWEYDHHKGDLESKLIYPWCGHTKEELQAAILTELAAALNALKLPVVNVKGEEVEPAPTDPALVDEPEHDRLIQARSTANESYVPDALEEFRAHEIEDMKRREAAV